PPPQIGRVASKGAADRAIFVGVVDIGEPFTHQWAYQTGIVDYPLSGVAASDEHPDGGILHRLLERQILFHIEARILVQGRRQYKGPEDVARRSTGHVGSNALPI